MSRKSGGSSRRSVSSASTAGSHSSRRRSQPRSSWTSAISSPSCSAHVPPARRRSSRAHTARAPATALARASARRRLRSTRIASPTAGAASDHQPVTTGSLTSRPSERCAARSPRRRSPRRRRPRRRSLASTAPLPGALASSQRSTRHSARSRSKASSARTRRISGPTPPSRPPEKGMPSRSKCRRRGARKDERSRATTPICSARRPASSAARTRAATSRTSLSGRAASMHSSAACRDGAGLAACSRAIRSKRSRSRFVNRPPASGSPGREGSGGSSTSTLAWRWRTRSSISSARRPVASAKPWTMTARAGRTASGSRTRASRAARSNNARWPIRPGGIASRQRRATRATASAVSRATSVASAASSASSTASALPASKPASSRSVTVASTAA